MKAVNLVVARKTFFRSLLRLDFGTARRIVRMVLA